MQVRSNRTNIIMPLLLDTHIFLWIAQDSHRISATILAELKDPGNQLFLCLASIWEMQIKYAIGRLALPTSVEQFFLIQQRLWNLQVVPIIEQHVWTLGTLPHHHRDPFNRMLIAQAIHDNLTLVSVDKIFTQYPVTLLDQSLQA